jgi:hypothetical protein
MAKHERMETRPMVLDAPAEPATARPEPDQPAVKAPLPSYGGKTPLPGDMVWYWEGPIVMPGTRTVRNAQLHVLPAMLRGESKLNPGCWDITIFGDIRTRPASQRSLVHWSDAPKLGCWTWRDPELLRLAQTMKPQVVPVN